MTPDRWRQIEELYQAAADLNGADRKAFLDGADPDLREEVETLLSPEGSVLDRPAWEGMDSPTVAAGVQLGPYRLEQQIGAGGMGKVFRAIDTRLHRAVAIKLSHQPFDLRFEREARAIAQLNHPHVCTLHDVGPNYLVMELVEGETLAARLKKGLLPVDRALAIGAQIADALAAAHAKSIVHRDLKPGNIMLTDHGVKVLDFGLAKRADLDDTFTGPGVVMGTLTYMAPEQVKGQAGTAQTDLFALGLILNELVTGRLPVMGASLGSLLANGDSVVLPAPSRARAGVSANLDRLVAQTLSADPAKRPDSAASIRDRLRALGAPENLSRRAAYVAGGTILVALAAAGWWDLRGRAAPVLHVARAIQIAPFPGDKHDPAFSPDGSLVAFSWAGEKGDSPGIYLIPATGGEPRRMTHAEERDISPAWAPGGGTIAFLRRHPGHPYELMIVPKDGGAEHGVRDVRMSELTERNARPILAWTNDGKGIVLPMNDPEHDGESLFRIDMDGAPPRRLQRPSAGHGIAAPAFSHDGKLFAYLGGGLKVQRLDSGEAPEGEAQIVPSIDGMTLFDVGHVSSPVWSPDGSRLLYVAGPRIMMWDSRTKRSEGLYVSPNGIQAMTARWVNDVPQVVFSVDGGQPEIHALNLKDGHTVVASSRLPLQGASVPSFSRDGKWISFAALDSSESYLWMGDPQGGHTRQVTSIQADRSYLSPDGKHIAFSGPGAQVYVAEVDPTTEIPKAGEKKRVARQVANTPFRMLSPDWSPDGKYLYVTRPGATYRILRVPSAGGEVEDLFEGDMARIDPAGNRIFYGESGLYGIWARSLDGDVRLNPPRLMVSDYMPPRGLDINKQGIYYLGHKDSPNPVAIRFFEFATGKVFDIAPAPLLRQPSITVSPDSSLLLYDTLSDSVGSLTFLEFGR